MAQYLTKGSKIDLRKRRCDFCGKKFEDDAPVLRLCGGINFCSDKCRQYYFQRR